MPADVLVNASTSVELPAPLVTITSAATLDWLNGELTTMLVLELDVIVAATPPNVTEVTPVKPVPVIVTDVPTGPLHGLTPVMFGVDRAATVLYENGLL